MSIVGGRGGGGQRLYILLNSWFMRWDKRSGQGKRWRRRGQVYRLGWDDYKLGVLYERELGFPTLKNGR